MFGGAERQEKGETVGEGVLDTHTRASFRGGTGQKAYHQLTQV